MDHGADKRIFLKSVAAAQQRLVAARRDHGRHLRRHAAQQRTASALV
nr:hypothetical protein [Cupriavidus pinatubonensis]